MPDYLVICATIIQNDEDQALHASSVNTNTDKERKVLARKMQHLWSDFVASAWLGQVASPVAHRKALTGPLAGSPQMAPMLNIQKG